MTGDVSSLGAAPQPPAPMAPGCNGAGWMTPPPRAGHFIVTLYGDVVEPRGGTLWMGRVIDICAAAGLSETLVRTAVSRLVAAGQLVGERVGRRSYYRLTAKAQIEFAQAAHVLFAPPVEPDDFAFLSVTEAELPFGFVPLRSNLAIGPYRDDLTAHKAFVLRGAVDTGHRPLQAFVAELWDLDPLEQAYRAVLARFGSLLEREANLAPQDALIARLLLVDGYRAAILRDPLLPRAALPPDWPGWKARTLFVRLYVALSDAADRFIQDQFLGPSGLSPGPNPELAARLASLKAECGAGNTVMWDEK